MEYLLEIFKHFSDLQDQRYLLLAEMGKKNFKDYNEIASPIDKIVPISLRIQMKLFHLDDEITCYIKRIELLGRTVGIFLENLDSITEMEGIGQTN